MKYSVAIRTLGTSGEMFVRELESIKRQTVQPEKVVVYIAEGYNRPDFTIGKEEYVWVKKGMMYQRILRYDEIDSPLLLLLDDDIELAPDSVEKLIVAMDGNQLDCIAPDTFRNHKMPLSRKIYAGITNLVFPHYSDKWAFKIHGNGSFSYNNNVKKDVYLSQSAAGPASLWKKDVFLSLHLDDELWLERFGFPFGEDALTYNKLFKNGYRLGVHYNSGVKNLDGKSSSGAFQRNTRKFYVRSIASLLIWYRICFSPSNISIFKKIWAALSFSIKAIWLLLVNTLAAIRLIMPQVIYYYLKGLFDGIKLIHSKDFQSLPNYVVR
jgi:GT2 family glycosyltransferase